MKRPTVTTGDYEGPDRRPSSNGLSRWLVGAWPLVISFVVVILAWGALQAQTNNNAKDIDKHDQRISSARDELELLKQQAIRVDERLNRVNEKLEDQRRATDEIKGDVKRVLDLLQTTPGRR